MEDHHLLYRLARVIKGPLTGFCTVLFTTGQIAALRSTPPNHDTGQQRDNLLYKQRYPE